MKDSRYYCLFKTVFKWAARHTSNLCSLLYSSFNSVPHGMWVTMWRPPSATFCFATLSLLAPLLCPSFGPIIFACLYTHLNHFTVILLMANFKLLPHGRRRKITTTCCCGFSSIFRVLRGACPTLLYDSYCSAENHSYIYSSLQFALFFGPGPKSIRLIHYLLNLWHDISQSTEKLSLYKLTICYESLIVFYYLSLTFATHASQPA